MSTHDTIPYPGIPFLPGNTFFDVNKTDFRKPHSLDYTNGYAVRRRPTLGIGLTLLPDATEPEPSTLLAKLRASNSARPSTPATSYAAQTQHQTSPARPRFVPAHVAFDKVVLRFDAYFKQTVHESAEQYHLRRVRIHYFVEDDSIAVVEPPVENSGFPQGVLIKRQRLPKSPDCFYDVRDFDRGKNVVFYGKTFRIVSCDEFTERYMLETEGIRLSPVEHMPDDPYQASRTRPARGRTLAERKDDRLRRFLENDRKVLRFFCVWDDRDSMFGEAREFVLHYYLVDDCVEVREVQKPNDGRDPFPILLRKQRLPKAFKDLSDLYDSSTYTWRDLKIGGVINVLGRRFLLDCDDYTRRFYSEHLGIPESAMQAIPLDKRAVSGAGAAPPVPTEPPAPYNGFGSVEDSLGSCKYLVLKPPKKDFIKMLENDHKVLRFVARMESRHREDEGRRFVVSFRLSDDTLEVYEPPQRNAGILGGKFMERTRVPLPGGPGPSDPAGPAYYSAHVLHVGARLRLAGRAFRLLDADEYVFDYFERRVDELRVQLTPTPAASERLNLGADDVAGFAARRRTSAAIGGRQLTAAMAGPSSSSASTAAAASAAAELATPALERSNRDSVVRKLRVAAAGPSAAGAAAEVLGRLRAADSSGSGVLERGAVVREAAGLWSGLLDEHEAITLCRVFEPRPRKVDYERLVATILTR